MIPTAHGQYLTQLTQFPLFFPINAYLVREDDGFTLIDTGYFANAKAILAATHALGAEHQNPVSRSMPSSAVRTTRSRSNPTTSFNQTIW